MYRNADGWIDQYKAKDALWFHDGNVKRPHALFTSGMHSNSFFNSRLVIADDALLREAASDLLELFVKKGGELSEVQGVVGPQTGATRLAELIRDEVVERVGSRCFWASPAKHEFEGKKSMVFSDEDLGAFPRRLVLPCEDVLTTGGSVNLATTAVVAAGGRVLPYILVLVNRSGLAEVGGKKIIALIDREMPMWTPDECPMCKAGSEALRPKDNWARLNAEY